VAPRPALRSLVLSQVCFGALLGLCVLIDPRYLLESNEGGVSNYGTRADTVVFYTVAFVSCAALLWRAAHRLPMTVRSARATRTGLEVVAGLLLGVLVSTYPYKLAPVLGEAHLVVSVLLFSVEMALVTWLMLVVNRSPLHSAAFSLALAGFALSGASTLGVLHVLLVGEATMEAGFAASTLLVCSAPQLPATQACWSRGARTRRNAQAERPGLGSG
jgi:hypothetical protein